MIYNLVLKSNDSRLVLPEVLTWGPNGRRGVSRTPHALPGRGRPPRPPPSQPSPVPRLADGISLPRSPKTKVLRYLPFDLDIQLAVKTCPVSLPGRLLTITLASGTGPLSPPIWITVTAPLLVPSPLTSPAGGSNLCAAAKTRPRHPCVRRTSRTRPRPEKHPAWRSKIHVLGPRSLPPFSSSVQTSPPPGSHL